MKQITLSTKPRTDLGRTPSKHLRDNGEIPAVIYGESGSRNLIVNAHEFTKAYRTLSGSATLINLKGEGDDSVFAIVQELQRNPRTDAFLHIDFREIVRGKEMEADIPVNTKGAADGVRNYGGVLELSAHTLRVRCRPRNLPESITIDVTPLEIGKSMHLSEIDAPEGVTFLGDPDMVLVSCVGASAGASGVTEEEEAEAEAEAAEGEEAPEAAEESGEAEEAASRE